MKITFFNDWRLGVLKGEDRIVDVSAVVAGIAPTAPHDVINAVIADRATFKGQIVELIAKEAGVPLSSVQLRAPLPRPINVTCMAVNYMEDGTRKEPALINTLGIFLVRLPLGYLFGIVWDGGLIGAWIGMSCDVALRWACAWWYFSRGHSVRTEV